MTEDQSKNNTKDRDELTSIIDELHATLSYVHFCLKMGGDNLYRPDRKFGKKMHTIAQGVNLIDMIERTLARHSIRNKAFSSDSPTLRSNLIISRTESASPPPPKSSTPPPRPAPRQEPVQTGAAAQAATMRAASARGTPFCEP